MLTRNVDLSDFKLAVTNHFVSFKAERVKTSNYAFN